MGKEIINSDRLRNKSVVVTGGNKGIGRAVCLRVAQEGASEIIILSRTPADEVIDQIGQLIPVRTRALWIPCDLADEASLVKAVDEVKKQTETTGKKVDVLVNNAGITEKELGLAALDMEATRREHIEKIHQTNYIGPSMLMYHLLKRDLFAHDEPYTVDFMQAANELPSVVNMGSILGTYWNMLQEKYNASKAALASSGRSLTASIYHDYGYFVRVNTVCPGYIVSEMTSGIPDRLARLIAYSTPLRRFGTTEEVAAAVAHLASDEVKFVTGMEYALDGGLGSGVSAAFQLYEAGCDVKDGKLIN